MATTTHYAAIDTAGQITGAVYGIGTTEAEAREDAARGLRRLSEPGPVEIVPCTAAAAAYVEKHGGAPSPALTVCAHGVCLASEEDDEQIWPPIRYRIVGANLPQDVDSDGYDTRAAAEGMASEYAEGDYRIEAYR